MILIFDVETSKAPQHFPWAKDSYLSLLCALEITDEGKIKKHHWVFNHNSVALAPMKVMCGEIQQLIDKADVCIAHNAKFDLHWLKSISIVANKIWDTMVVEYLLNGQDNTKSNSLNETAKRYGLELKHDAVKEYWDSGINTANIPMETLREYCFQDCLITYKVYLEQQKRKQGMSMDKLIKLSNYFVNCLEEIEWNGMKVDVPYLQKSKVEYKARLDELQVTLLLFIQDFFKTDFEFNLSSNDHLSVILYGGCVQKAVREKYQKTLKGGEVKDCERWGVLDIPFQGLGFKPNKKDECKKKGFYKTNKAVLATLNPKTKAQKYFLATIEELSRVEKIYTTYLEGMEKHIQQDSIIHPSFNQTFTVTGRLSSSQPNFQNLPRGKTDEVAKRLFIPKGHDRVILNGDLSALEWCVGAELSQDQTMIQEIIDGTDIHTANSLSIFGTDAFRQESKTISFRSLYGGSAYAFFMDSNMPKKPLEEWEEIHRKFYAKYKSLGEWQKSNYKTVCEQGWYQSFTGRKYVFHKENGTYSFPAVCNYIVQGTATGDLVPFVMLLIRKEIRDKEVDANIICQVHDSIVCDVHKNHIDALAEIVWQNFRKLPQHILQYWKYNWRTPMTGEIEVGDNYKDLVKIYGKEGKL